MDSALLASLLSATAVAGGALWAWRARERALREASRGREAAAAAAREALVLQERALRERLHEANETLWQRAEALQRILHASSELKAHLPLDAVLSNVVRAAAASLGYRRVLLSLLDRADGLLVPRAHVGLAAEWPALERLRLPAERPAARPEDGPEVPTPLATLPGRAASPAFTALPLLAAGQLVGLLEMDDPEREPALPGDADALLGLFASQAVTAIRLARAYETARLGSLRDPLTGVANHGHFQDTLHREIGRHERGAARLVLLMVDLDDFKAVNDRHGHPVGDAVLKSVVARLLASVRDMDTVTRYGGEEFAVILPQTDAANGLRVAERLRANVAKEPVDAGLAGPLRVTVSIGLAVYPDDAAGKGALVDCADKALYAAKKTGKNRVVRYARVPASAEAFLTERA